MYPIVFSINNDYASYLCICLMSLLTYVKQNDRYEVYVLHSDLSEEHKKNILQLKEDNFNIKFINVESIVNNHKDNFSLNTHFTIETYYRFFLPQIFPNLDKVLYLDADTMIMKDISPLFNIDINGYYLGVTHDCEIVRASNFIGTKYSNYFIKTLNVDPTNYFQAGVMLVNLKKMREDNITDKLLDALERIGSPKFVDQDILNTVCRDKVLFIPPNWNYTWHLQFCDSDYLEHLPDFFRTSYKEAEDEPYIIHFTGNKMKPIDYPNAKYSDIFWYYAKQSMYYDYLIKQKENSLLHTNLTIKKTKRKIQKYKLLNLITFGFFKNNINKKVNKKETDMNRMLKLIQKK